MSVGGYGNSGDGIITDGLIFSVDPYNTKSYVSGSTDIYGLTVNKPNGTLENGVTFNGKSLSLDGTNQDITVNTGFGLNPPTLPVTLDLWVYIPSTGPTGNALFYLDNYNNIYYGLGISYGANNVVTFSVFDGGGATSNDRRTLISPNNSIPNDEWVHISCIYRNPTSGFDMTCYINLVDVGGTPSGSGGPIGWSSNVGSRTRFAKNPILTAYTEMEISQAKVYDRELSFDEIKQNYNALKWRFR